MSSPLIRSNSAMSSVDTEALFSRIHKEQSSQLELLKRTKRAMDKSIIAREANGDNDGPSLATLSFEILNDLLDELILEVVTESHREMTLMRSICPICKTRCRNYAHQAGLDIFGLNPQTTNSQTYECVSCQRSYPAQRYAPHLEKCLGLAGRASSRVASRRIGAERAGSGSPFTPLSYSDDREASDSDKDLIEKKRKKIAMNGGTGASNGSNGSTKSSHSSGTKVKKQKVVDSESQDSPMKNSKSTGISKVTIHLPGKGKSLSAATSDSTLLGSSSSPSTTPSTSSTLSKSGGGGTGADATVVGKGSKGSSTVSATVGTGIGEIKLGYLDPPSLTSSLQSQDKAGGSSKSGGSSKKSSLNKKASTPSSSLGALNPSLSTTPTSTPKKKQGGGSGGGSASLSSSSLSKKSSGASGKSSNSGSGGGTKAAKDQNLGTTTGSADHVVVADIV